MLVSLLFLIVNKLSWSACLLLSFIQRLNQFGSSKVLRGKMAGRFNVLFLSRIRRLRGTESAYVYHYTLAFKPVFFAEALQVWINF